MGIIRAVGDSLSGVLADQWKDIITAEDFDEHTVVVSGKKLRSRDGLGHNGGSQSVITNGSVIYVPEKTAAVVFNQSGIENVITEPGGFEFRNEDEEELYAAGEAATPPRPDGPPKPGTYAPTVFDRRDRRKRGIVGTIADQASQRFEYGGINPEERRVAYVNLRELRGIKFGTRGPMAYNDLFYGVDLEIFSYGSFSVQVTDPVALLQRFVPAGLTYYSLDASGAREQLVSEFLHSFISSVNKLSKSVRISQVASQADEVAEQIAQSTRNAGSWPGRFGLRLVSVAIENVELSDESKALVREFSARRMGVRAYEDVSAMAGNMAAQQMIAEGVRERGMGDAGGMIMGMGFAGSLNPVNAAPQASAAPAPAPAPAPARPTLDDQIETLKKLKALLDEGILSQEEFDLKKKQVLGL